MRACDRVYMRAHVCACVCVLVCECVSAHVRGCRHQTLLHGGCVVLAENAMLQNNCVHHD